MDLQGYARSVVKLTVLLSADKFCPTGLDGAVSTAPTVRGRTMMNAWLPSLDMPMTPLDWPGHTPVFLFTFGDASVTKGSPIQLRQFM